MQVNKGIPMKNSKHDKMTDDFYMTPGVVKEFQKIQAIFMTSYIKNKDKMPLNIWLEKELGENLPTYSADKIKNISDDIISSIKNTEEKKKSLESAMKKGISKESWLTNQLKKITSHMSTDKSLDYLKGIDKEVANANELLNKCILTKSGGINRNPNLHGFLAEVMHVASFNINAATKKSKYRARIPVSKTGAYNKNSVDILIEDVSKPVNKVVKRYQCKYCKSPHITNAAFKKGKYYGQQLLVPFEHLNKIVKKHISHLSSPDGVTSDNIERAKTIEVQKAIQNYQNVSYSHKNISLSGIAKGIARETGKASLLGVGIGACSSVVKQKFNNEDGSIETEKVVKDSLETGTDFGLKAAVAGALKIAADRELLGENLRELDSTGFADIAFLAVENFKLLYQIGTKKITIQEGIEKTQVNTMSMIAGNASGKTGEKVGEKVGEVAGSAIGTSMGPTGAKIGGFIGKAIGHIGGAVVGEAAAKGGQKIMPKCQKVVKEYVTKRIEIMKNKAKVLTDKKIKVTKELTTV